AHKFVEELASREIIACVDILPGVVEGPIPVGLHGRINYCKVGARQCCQRKRERDWKTLSHSSPSAFWCRLAPPPRTVWLNLQRHDKRGAHGKLTFDGYLAAVGFDDFFRNR